MGGFFRETKGKVDKVKLIIANVCIKERKKLNV